MTLEDVEIEFLIDAYQCYSQSSDSIANRNVVNNSIGTNNILSSAVSIYIYHNCVGTGMNLKSIRVKIRVNIHIILIIKLTIFIYLWQRFFKKILRTKYEFLEPLDPRSQTLIPQIWFIANQGTNCSFIYSIRIRNIYFSRKLL